MADSTLDRTGEESPIVNLGHGTGALGPSDSSDTGSDVVGGPGMDEGLSDEQARRMPLRSSGSAGRDLGDGDLDADSDRAGTGERGAAGVESGGPNDTATTTQPGIAADADGLDDADDVDDVNDAADPEVGIERIDSDDSNAATDESLLDDVPASDGAT